MRRGRQCSQSAKGPLAHAAGASVIPRPCSGGLGGPQRERIPLAHVVGAPVVPKRKRPPSPCSGGLGSPQKNEAPSSMRRGPR